MGGATNRLFTILSATTTAAAAAPMVLLRRRRNMATISSTTSLLFIRRRRRTISSVPTPRRRVHSRAAASSPFNHDVRFLPTPSEPKPWPEWSRLIDALSASGYFNNSIDSRAGEELLPNASPDFARTAAVCLAFAEGRQQLIRLLSSKDVEVVVGNCGNYSGHTYVLDVDDVSTVDLMRLILVYVSNLIFPSESTQIHNRELVESSIRKLLFEIVKLCYVAPDSSSYGGVQDLFSDGHLDPMRPVVPKVEMKRGDWNCPRCNFMNFARNPKCIECEEARPKAQITGGEWECPQCNFYNYGKNAVCLKCDCKRSGGVSISAGNDNRGYKNSTEIESKLAENEEKAQRWFRKISQMDGMSDAGTAIADDDFPEIMPMRKGVNRFVVSTRKTPLERRLANSQLPTNSGNVGSTKAGQNSTYVPFVPLPADMFAKKPEISEEENRRSKVAGSHENVASTARPLASNNVASSQVESKTDTDFPEIMPMRKGENRFVLSKKKDRSLTSPAYKRQMALEQANETKFVPFVPFPPDYFSKKDDKQQTDITASPPNLASEEKLPQTPSNARAEIKDRDSTPNSSLGGPRKSLEGSAVRETDPLDMSEEAKAERWFRRVAQIKDISELSQIPDEDFPSIMPMRKGVNRFVISKRKTPMERKLTTPQYRKNIPSVSSESDSLKDKDN